MVITRSNPDEFLQYTADPELLIRNRKRSRRLETSVETRKKTSLLPKVEGTTECKDKKTTSNDWLSDFECNICIEVAKQPVVTCCGHLFCWPCLYRWLHFNGGRNECPVCKGNVSESSLVPIYGRGNSKAPTEVNNGEDGLKIPPRPKGNRVQDLTHRAQSPLSRRPAVERSGTSWMGQSPSPLFRSGEESRRSIHSQLRDHDLIVFRMHV